MTDANAATPIVPLEGSYLESGSTSPVVPLEGYYFEIGCTVLHDVALDATVYSSSDPSIERFYQEDLILDMPHTPAMTTSNAKDFSLNCTIPHLSEVMAGAKLGGMIYNPNYLRDVYERVPGPAS